MMKLKIIPAFIILVLSAKYCQAQIGNLSSPDYSAKGSINIGSGITLKKTHSAAYLEIGDSTNSKKTIILPRGSIDSVSGPRLGSIFFNIADSSVYVFNTVWRKLGTGSGGGGGAGISEVVGNYGIDNLNDSTVQADTLELATKDHVSKEIGIIDAEKLNKTDTTDKWVNGIVKNAGGDSLIFWIGTTRYAVKDNSGAGTDNTNTGTGFKLVKPDQSVKTLFAGDRTNIDSTTNTNGITVTSIDSTGTIAVKNISDLFTTDYQLLTSKNKGSNDKPFIIVLGWAAPGDGGIRRMWWSDTSTATVDSGYVVKPNSVSGAGRWLLEVNNSTINTKQYGILESNSGVLNRSRMLRLLAFAKANPSIVRKIFIDKGNYPLSDSLLVDFNVQVDGVGSGYDGSGFSFPADKKALRVVGAKANFSNIFFSGSHAATGYDSSKHGITINAEVYFYNVKAIGFSGSGFYIYGDGLDSPPSNTDHARFEYCYSEANGVHGFYIRGGDANIITFDQCEARDNNAGGFIESGFLGNHYVNCHSVGNSQWNVGHPRSLAKYGGAVYQALQTGFLGRPDLDPTRWYTNSELAGWNVSSVIPTFDSSTYFFLGGAYNMDGENALSGENQFTVIENCYSEGGMPYSYAGNSVMVIGGDHGTPFREGNILKSYNKKFHVRSRGMIVGLNIFDSLYTEISPLGLILGRNANNINAGVGIEHDITNDIFKFRDVAAYGSGATPSNPFSIGGYTSTASTWGRTDNDQRGALMIKDFILFRDVSTAADYKLFSFHTDIPTTGNFKRGDFRLYAQPTSKTSPLAFRNITGGSPGTWDTLWAVPSGGTTGQALVKNSNTAGDIKWATVSGGGLDTTYSVTAIYRIPGVDSFYYRINGTVYAIKDSTGAGGGSVTGTGSANQVAYWSGTSSLTGNSSFTADPTNESAYTFNSSSSSPLAGTYYRVIKSYATNASNGNIIQYLLGKADNTNDAIVQSFHYNSSGSATNYFGMTPYGAASDMFRIYGSGNVTIDGADIGEKFYVNGNVHIGGRTALNSTLIGDLASPAASAVLELKSTTKGFLLTRVTTAQMNAIGSPATGLMVINTDTIGTAVGSGLFIYDGSGWHGVPFSYQVAAGGGAPVDTSNKWVNLIERVPGKDSIIFWIGATRYAIKDSTGGGVTDHGALTGLGDDDHTQYALLAGRSSGQTFIGGTGTTDQLVLQSTSGVGTTGADIVFKVGNAGGNTAGSFLNSGALELNGQLSKINGVALSWPGANSAGLLSNNGSGGLTWAAQSSINWGGLVSGTNTQSGTITVSNNHQGLVFNGSSPTTWTMPAISGNTNRFFFFKNIGSATLTITRAASDQFYTTSLVNSFDIAAGGYATVWNNGTNWLVHYNAGGGGSISTLSDVSLTSLSTDDFLKYNGSAWVNRTPANVRTDLGLVIGTNVQAYDADLTTWAGITPGSNVGTFLATPSSANLRSALTDENGTGAALFDGATSPVFTTPNFSSIVNTGTLTLPTVTSTITAYKEANIASNATWSPTGDGRDNFYDITAQAAAVTTISNPSGTPANHNTLTIRVVDNGTARAISGWGSQYRASTNLAFPTTTTLGKTMYMKFIYNSAGTGTWDLVSVLDGF